MATFWLCLFYLHLFTNHAQAQFIEILENIPKETILSESWLQTLINERKPLIIRQSINTQWTASTKWTRQYLIDTIPTLDNVILHNTSSFLFTNTAGHPLSDYSINPYPRRTFKQLSTASFFEIGLDKEQNEAFPTYSGHPMNLQADIDDHDELANLFQKVTNSKTYRTYLWLSFAPMLTSFHYDVDPNLYFQIKGSKKWQLIHPKYYQNMSTYPHLHPSDRQSQIKNINQTLSLDALECIEFELRAGDMLFLPSFWFHKVQTVSPWSASFNFWVNGREINRYYFLQLLTLPKIPLSQISSKFFLQLLTLPKYLNFK